MWPTRWRHIQYPWSRPSPHSLIWTGTRFLDPGSTRGTSLRLIWQHVYVRRSPTLLSQPWSVFTMRSSHPPSHNSSSRPYPAAQSSSGPPLTPSSRHSSAQSGIPILHSMSTSFAPTRMPSHLTQSPSRLPTAAPPRGPPLLVGSPYQNPPARSSAAGSIVAEMPTPRPHRRPHPLPAVAARCRDVPTTHTSWTSAWDTSSFVAGPSPSRPP